MKIAVALVHIFFATLWLGSAFFYTLLVLPRLALLDARGRLAFVRSLRRALVPLLSVSAIATLVSGIVMMVQLHPQHPGPLSHTSWGVALVIGTLASLAALAVAVFVERRLRVNDRSAAESIRPTAMRGERRLRLVALALLLVALATMAVARYS